MTGPVPDASNAAMTLGAVESLQANSRATVRQTSNAGAYYQFIQEWHTIKVFRPNAHANKEVIHCLVQ